MVENQNGFQDKKSICFYKLIRVLCILQEIQTNKLMYIIESVPIILESK